MTPRTVLRTDTPFLHDFHSSWSFTSPHPVPSSNNTNSDADEMHPVPQCPKDLMNVILKLSKSKHLFFEQNSWYRSFPRPTEEFPPFSPGLTVLTGQLPGSSSSLSVPYPTGFWSQKILTFPGFFLLLNLCWSPLWVISSPASEWLILMHFHSSFIQWLWKVHALLYNTNTAWLTVGVHALTALLSVTIHLSLPQVVYLNALSPKIALELEKHYIRWEHFRRPSWKIAQTTKAFSLNSYLILKNLKCTK